MTDYERVYFEWLFSQFKISYHNVKRFVFPDGRAIFKSNTTFKCLDKDFTVFFDCNYINKQEETITFQFQEDVLLWYFGVRIGKIDIR